MNSLQISTRDVVLDKYATGIYATTEVRCLCGNGGGQLIAERDRYGLPSPSVLCRQCGVVRTSPRLTDSSLGAFYDTDYRPLYDGSIGARNDFLELQRARGLNIMHFVTRFLPAGSRVADLGCGAGWTLIPFRDAGHEVAGCDLGSTYLEAGRTLGLDLRHGDYTTLSDLAPFNLIILSHVFEHLPNPQELMKGILPLLAADALVYIEVPGLRGIPMAFGDPLRYFQNAHLWNFDLGTLTATLADYGYRRVAGNEFIRSVFTPDPTAVAADSGGYDRAVKALALAERTRLVSDSLRAAKSATRHALGPRRASKLRRAITR